MTHRTAQSSNSSVARTEQDLLAVREMNENTLYIYVYN